MLLIIQPSHKQAAVRLCKAHRQYDMKHKPLSFNILTTLKSPNQTISIEVTRCTLHVGMPRLSQSLIVLRLRNLDKPYY